MLNKHSSTNTIQVKFKVLFDFYVKFINNWHFILYLQCLESVNVFIYLFKSIISGLDKHLSYFSNTSTADLVYFIYY